MNPLPLRDVNVDADEELISQLSDRTYAGNDPLGGLLRRWTADIDADVAAGVRRGATEQAARAAFAAREHAGSAQGAVGDPEGTVIGLHPQTPTASASEETRAAAGPEPKASGPRAPQARTLTVHGTRMLVVVGSITSIFTAGGVAAAVRGTEVPIISPIIRAVAPLALTESSGPLGTRSAAARTVNAGSRSGSASGVVTGPGVTGNPHTPSGTAEGVDPPFVPGANPPVVPGVSPTGLVPTTMPTETLPAPEPTATDPTTAPTATFDATVPVDPSVTETPEPEPEDPGPSGDGGTGDSATTPDPTPPADEQEPAPVDTPQPTSTPSPTPPAPDEGSDPVVEETQAPPAETGALRAAAAAGAVRARVVKRSTVSQPIPSPSLRRSSPTPWASPASALFISAAP